MTDKEERFKEIEKKIKENRVCLFMKGNKEMPQCGFSSKVVHILDSLEVSYESFNVLEDPFLRTDLKEYSNWPTFPQLYINNEFIGGCDIVIELFESGELKTMLESQKAT